MAEVLISLLPEPVRGLLPEGASALAALHDLGKISPGFQQKCSAWIDANRSWFVPDGGFEPKHQRISQLVIETETKARLRGWAEAVGAHHGRVQGDDPLGDTGGRQWQEARKQLRIALEAEFGLLPFDDAPRETVKWLVAGLITLADWLGSDEGKFDTEEQEPLSKSAQQSKAFDIVMRLQLHGGEVARGVSFHEAFESRLKGRSPRPLQEHFIAAQDPQTGIYVIEDVMGSGKTEAALWLTYRLLEAGRARGLYFGLPTRVTSDRIHRRVREFLASVSPDSVEPPLVHGKAWLQEIPKSRSGWHSDSCEEDQSAEAQALAARRWFASSRRGLLAPYAVGTIDQALMGVVAAKWFFLRQFALSGKVVVIDEVHSYDLYTGTLIQHLVQRLSELGATPVLLSATLTRTQRASLLGEPELGRDESTPYPAITYKPVNGCARTFAIGRSGESKSVRLEFVQVPSFDDARNAADLALSLANVGQNVVWIRNTVRHAQEAYRWVKGAAQEGQGEIGLLHSRYPAFQREACPDLSLEELKASCLHEERWLWMLGKPEHARKEARPKASVLVATQVVEQSVDIDADVLITDLAPTDMILQRLGRLHRHERGDRGQPTVHIVVPAELADQGDSMAASEIKRALGGVGWVYDPYVLMRSWREWRQLNNTGIILPDGLRSILETTYADLTPEPRAWSELKDEMLQRREHLMSLALSATNVRGQPLEHDQEGFLTRFSTQRQVLLLLLRWVSPDANRGGNPSEIHLLNKTKLHRRSYCTFQMHAARELHRNTVPIPAWWLPKDTKRPNWPELDQYFDEEPVVAVYDGVHQELIMQGKVPDQPPIICYSPAEGLWLKREAPHEGVTDGEEGEYEDGMF